MAKKKIEAVETETVATESLNTPAAEMPEATNNKVEDTSVHEPVSENNPADIPSNEEESEVAKDGKALPEQDFSAIPPQAVDYLKRHPEVDALYIDKFGGMFPKDTPQVFAPDAVLYHNPYFKQ